MKFKDLYSGLRGYFRNRGSRRTARLLFLAPLILYVLIIPSWILERASKRELNSLRIRQTEFQALTREYEWLREQIDEVEKKASLGDLSGVAQAMDEVISPLGIRQKMRSVRIIGKRGLSDELSEETAEIQMEKLTLNELVNVLYRMKEAKTNLLLKRATIKKPFENPELLDLTMTAAVFTKK